jgi:hypothetical protein
VNGRKQLRRLAAFATVMGVLAWVSTPASAELYVEQTGPLIPGGSWQAPFSFFSTDLAVDQIAAQITFGDPFSDPEAIYDFSAAGWSQDTNDGFFASASGPGAQFMVLWLDFSGDATAPVEFDVAAFSGATFLGSYHASYSGSGFGFVSMTLGDWDGTPSPVRSTPAPGAALLGVIGLGMIGCVKLRL